MTLEMEHTQILKLQILQIKSGDKSENIYKLVWMREELTD